MRVFVYIDTNVSVAGIRFYLCIVYVGFSIFLPNRPIYVSKHIFYLCGYMDSIYFAMVVFGRGG